MGGLRVGVGWVREEVCRWGCEEVGEGACEDSSYGGGDCDGGYVGGWQAGGWR